MNHPVCLFDLCYTRIRVAWGNKESLSVNKKKKTFFLTATSLSSFFLRLIYVLLQWIEFLIKKGQTKSLTFEINQN